MAQYNSKHTGSQIDSAVTRALAGGAIDKDIAKKMDATESTDYPGCYYRTVDGVQEWINPPMNLGVEYRTTERHLKKPVYVKAVNCGAVPANTGKNIGLNASNVDVPLSATGYLARTSDTYKFSVPYLYTDTNKAITQGVALSLRNDNDNRGVINVQTHNTFTNEYTLYAIARYTKTTD